MKSKLILHLLLVTSFITINAMEEEQKEANLKNLLLEPATLKFQAAWTAISNSQSLEQIGEPSIVELGNKIKNIQQCNNCSYSEKKLFVNLANSPNITEDKIKKYFPELIKKYRKKNKELKYKDQLLNAILLYAIDRNIFSLAQCSIDAGANVNVKNKWDTCALSCALYRASGYKGSEEIVILLLNAGANTNSKDMGQYIPLRIAAQFGHKNIVKMLLNKGADVNAKDDKLTALLAAASGGYKKIVKILIKSGATITAKELGSNYIQDKEIFQILMGNILNQNQQTKVN